MIDSGENPWYFVSKGAIRMIQRLSDPARAAELFAGWQETIVWSALEGVMGTVYAVDDASAMVRSGDFAFFASSFR